MKTKLPKRIKVKFTEEDRISAGRYTDSANCLMATALKRMGYNTNRKIGVYPGIVHIGPGRYRGEVYAHTVKRNDMDSKPYYEESVVGTTITLTREHARR